MDKKAAAEKIRARLESRLARFLGCDAKELPALRLGDLVHLMFLLWGDTEELGGFNTSASGVAEIVSREVMWEMPKKEETEIPRGVIVVN